MPVDYQNLQQHIHELGIEAVRTEEHLKNKRQQARDLLLEPGIPLENVRNKVLHAVDSHDPNLRCALPRENTSEHLAACIRLPAKPSYGTIIAADGSQINPDRHAEVNYCLINVGAIQMQNGSSDPPKTHVQSHLIYGRDMYAAGRIMTVNTVALKRDLNERKLLAELGAQAQTAPVITFTDGPLELWGSTDPDTRSTFQNTLLEYHQVLINLQQLKIITAGYVDRPGANLIVRLLEVAMIPTDELPKLAASHPLEGITDLELYQDLLAPGERSAVFSILSNSSRHYRGDIRLNFFYLNVSKHSPKIARVEIPEWVAVDPEMINALHSALFDQCQVIGGRAYPYLLHRAHEVAVVTLAERDQITQLILNELQLRGFAIGEKSEKQQTKELGGKKRYK